VPTVAELNRAHKMYEQNEPREVFYRAAIELLGLRRSNKTSITLVESLAVLLQSWNARYYVSQHHGRFPREHFTGLKKLLQRHDDALAAYRDRAVESLAAEDEKPVARLFAEFEVLLGPVGAAKALHLLAPRFFPLWDRDIAAGDGCRLGRSGTNAPRYWRFMGITRDECVALGGEAKCGTGLVKRLDEFKFCRARGWVMSPQTPRGRTTGRSG
jgi:hypothetical protein